MKKVYEETLPIDIQERIKDFKNEYLKAKQGKGYSLDLMADELYGSINSAQHGYEITEETADYLRSKYLYDFDEKEVFGEELEEDNR